MFSQSISKHFDNAKDTYIFSLGLLGDQNHMATGLAFIKLAAQPGKLQDGAKLGLADIQQALPAILTLDAKLKAGSISPATFRAEAIQALKLKEITDAEFDAAWCAMLGDTKKVLEQIETLRKQHPNVNFILVSATSSIHINHILNSEQAAVNNPLSLVDTVLHVSYLSDAYKANPINKSLFEEVFKFYKPEIKKTTIIINPESNTYADVKKRDEANAASVKLWAESLGMIVAERLGKESVAETINRFKATTVSTGLKQ